MGVSSIESRGPAAELALIPQRADFSFGQGARHFLFVSAPFGPFAREVAEELAAQSSAMRQIGSIPSEADAQRFGDYLLAEGIPNSIEQSPSHSFAVWVENDDQLERAKGELDGFLAEPANPTADLIAAWLGLRLGIEVVRGESAGPGITCVSFETPDGRVTISRPDGRMATLSWPGHPERRVALHRRETADLIAEELRRLEPDEVYAETLRALAAGPSR